jgi:hypothetical protein
MDEDTIPDHISPQHTSPVPLPVLAMCQELSDEDTIPDHISPQHTSPVPLPVLAMCQELSELSMINAFGKKPFPCGRRPS